MPVAAAIYALQPMGRRDRGHVDRLVPLGLHKAESLTPPFHHQLLPNRSTFTLAYANHRRPPLLSATPNPSRHPSPTTTPLHHHLVREAALMELARLLASSRLP